jgi:hypothetical protein
MMRRSSNRDADDLVKEDPEGCGGRMMQWLAGGIFHSNGRQICVSGSWTMWTQDRQPDCKRRWEGRTGTAAAHVVGSWRHVCLEHACGVTRARMSSAVTREAAVPREALDRNT